MKGPPPGYRYVWVTPYYDSKPWTQMLVSTMRHFSHIPPDRRHELPTPELDQAGTGQILSRHGGQQLAWDYHQLQERLAEFAQIAREWRAMRSEAPLLAEYDDSRGLTLGATWRSVAVLLRKRPELASVGAIATDLGGEPVKGGVLDFSGGARGGVAIASAARVCFFGYEIDLFADGEMVTRERMGPLWGEAVAALGSEPAMVLVLVGRSRFELHAAGVFARAIAERYGGVVRDDGVESLAPVPSRDGNGFGFG